MVNCKTTVWEWQTIYQKSHRRAQGKTNFPSQSDLIVIQFCCWVRSYLHSLPNLNQRSDDHCAPMLRWAPEAKFKSIAICLELWKRFIGIIFSWNLIFLKLFVNIEFFLKIIWCTSHFFFYFLKNFDVTSVSIILRNILNQGHGLGGANWQVRVLFCFLRKYLLP